MGELPGNVFNVGALGVENIISQNIMPKEEIMDSLSLSGIDQYFLVSLHPETSEKITPQQQLNAITESLGSFKSYSFIWTSPNADKGGVELQHEIKNFCKSESNHHYFDSLGQSRYLSAIKHSSGLIGNSSSGIIEAPYLNVPVSYTHLTLPTTPYV